MLNTKISILFRSFDFVYWISKLVKKVLIMFFIEIVNFRLISYPKIFFLKVSRDYFPILCTLMLRDRKQYLKVTKGKY